MSARILSHFIAGVLTPFVGLILIAKTPSLFRLFILPFIVTLVVFVVGLAIGLPFITSLVMPFTQAVHAHGTFAKILPILIWPALALALIFILLNLTRLVAAPFYGLLAEKVLILQGVIDPSAKKRNLLRWTLESFRQTRSALLKTALFLLMGLVLGLLSFIPGLSLFTSFSFLILLAYDVVDYALEALEWPLERRVTFFRQHLAVFLGLGLSLGFVFLVPGLNFFLLPASVAGASDLVRRMIRE